MNCVNIASAVETHKSALEEVAHSIYLTNIQFDWKQFRKFQKENNIQAEICKAAYLNGYLDGIRPLCRDPHARDEIDFLIRILYQI